jgi:hypothetical protein
MSGSYPLVAVIGLSLVLAGCGEDSVPPSAPRTERAPVPAVHLRADSVSRTQIRELGAEALFSSIDESECLATDVFVVGAEQARKQGPGKPAAGPIAIVQVFQFNFCTFEVLRDIFGETNEATVQANRSRLSRASLEATIPAFDFVNQVEVQVVVDLAWTAVGALTSESERFRLKGPTAHVNFSFKGTSRPAEVSGTVAVGGENLATSAVFADIYRARLALFERLSTP